MTWSHHASEGCVVRSGVAHIKFVRCQVLHVPSMAFEGTVNALEEVEEVCFYLKKEDTLTFH